MTDTRTGKRLQPMSRDYFSALLFMCIATVATQLSSRSERGGHGVTLGTLHPTEENILVVEDSNFRCMKRKATSHFSISLVLRYTQSE